MKNIEPTGKQIEYMNFINKFIDQQDNFPSIEVMADFFGVCVNSAMDHVKALEKKGYIEKCQDVKKYRRTSAFKVFMSVRPERLAA